ncbi:MAG: N-methyl-L-tryptophan oxidase [Phycisphaerales bacterium]|nr:N-methyl-L-tryptophan oxidase [Phycisphaerales bacterium]
MGSAACRHLASRGARVVGLEQFQVGHDRGSSHGHSRVVRTAYFEHPDYVPLLLRAFELWDDLSEKTGIDCLHRSGAMFCGLPGSEVYVQSLASARQHGLEVEDLSPEVLRDRFPQFRFPDGMAAVLEPGAGFVIPENGIEAHLRLARQDGAEIREGVRVDTIDASDAGVILHTDSGTLHADKVVVTAGAWTSRLLQDLGVPLEVHRQVLCWFEALDASACNESAMPAWIMSETSDHSQGDYYGIPTWRGQPGPAGVKVGCHGPGAIVDPDHPVPSMSTEEVARFERDVHRILPGVLGKVVATATCLYTMSPDTHFLIDSLPQESRIVVAGGFSGHGYKFAPVVGEILADHALEGGTSHPAGFLGLHSERF